MRIKFHNRVFFMLPIMAACMFLICSCRKDEIKPWMADPDHYRKVVIFYAAGHNNLNGAIRDNINLLARESIDIIDYDKDALIVFSHLGSSDSDSEPCLIKVRNRMGQVMLDTLMTMPGSTISASAETLDHVLTYIRNEMPAEEYDLLFSSHATGYLPEGYYNNFLKYEQEAASGRSMAIPAHSSPVPYTEPEPDPSRPMVKTVGQESRPGLSYEIDIIEFAKALPMYFNAIIFDACLMGGIEVAYELKDKCRYIVASQAEILVTGMDYSSMGKRLFSPETDLPCLCKDYYEMYRNHPEGGPWRSATISLIDCTQLEPIAQVCARLFEKYRKSFTDDMLGTVQQYFTTNSIRKPHFFYDLRDILKKCGCSAEELSVLDETLEDCIQYKAATDYFFENDRYGFKIETHCGLSMYLPFNTGFYGNGSAYLNNYYKSLAWNKATGLVK